MGVSNKKTCNTLGAKKVFDWYISNDSLIIEKTFNRGKEIRKIEFTRSELHNIINFINTEYLVTLSNSIKKVDDIRKGDYIKDDYFKKGLGPYIYNFSKDRKDIIHKTYAMSQLVSILVNEDILDYRNKIERKFYIKYNKEKAIKKIDNMFALEVDFEMYSKLVRDKIPSIIEEDGKTCEVEIAAKEEIARLLEEKLMEEVQEYIENKSIEELADVMEVLFSLANNLGYTEEYLLKKRNEKFEERGGFKKGIVLKAIKQIN